MYSCIASIHSSDTTDSSRINDRHCTTSPRGCGIIYVDAFKPQVVPDMAKGGNTEAIKWLNTLYLSEVAFFLHLPLFLPITSATSTYNRTHDETPTTPTQVSHEATTVFGHYANAVVNRLTAFYRRVSSEKYRRVTLWRKRHPHPHPYVQLFFFLARCSLNLAWYILVFHTMRYTDNRTTADAIHLVFHGHHAYSGWMCFVASLVLWVLSYFHQRYHLLHVLRKAPVAGLIRIPARMYYFAHFGGLNFSFDLPGASVPSVKLSRFLVCAINVCAGVIVVFTTFVIEPFTKVRTITMYKNKTTHL
jgi:hypothetical protein